ncbi:MAG: hypothetical protein ABEJ68_10020 [Halobacteriaceae archaeon]
MNDSREGGVEFGDVRNQLRDLSYPLTGADVIAACGDGTMDLADGTRTVSEALKPCRDHTFESPADVEATLFSMVPVGAVGRKHYTDRGCLSTFRAVGSL